VIRLPIRHWVFIVVSGWMILAPLDTLVEGADWDSPLQRLETLLEAGEYKRAVKRARKVRARIVADISEAGESTRPAAETLVIQAVAEANLGRDHDALWHWYLAQSYLPGLPELDLQSMGRAAELLQGRAVEDLPPEVAVAPAAEDSRYREVKIRGTHAPSYPKSLAKSGREGVARIRFLIDDQGRQSRPVVVDGGFVPTMAFPVAESLRRWRFAPAEEDGEPLHVWYELDVRYR